MKATEHRFDGTSLELPGDGVHHVENAPVRAAGKDHQSIFLPQDHDQLVVEAVHPACAFPFDKEVAVSLWLGVALTDLGQDKEARCDFRGLVQKLKPIGVGLKHVLSRPTGLFRRPPKARK